MNEFLAATLSDTDKDIPEVAYIVIDGYIQQLPDELDLNPP